MKKVILIFLLSASFAWGQAEPDRLKNHIIYEQWNEFIKIGGNFYDSGFNDGMLCVSTYILEYEYKGEKRPKMSDLLDRCRYIWNVEKK